MKPQRTMQAAEQIPLLEVKNFTLSFKRFGKGLREIETEVIRNLHLTIHQGETVAIVGASGSGKSLLANAVLGILPANAFAKGEIHYKGNELTTKRQEQLRGREIVLIPQSVNALDPLMKTGRQVQDAAYGSNKIEKQQAVFHKVALPEKAADLYPFELSGGMARRVLVSTAMVSGAQLIVADEPTPGLDPHALQETIFHMKQLLDGSTSMMFITHDIETALQIADRIAVFRGGEIVEIARAEDFSGAGEKLQNPYTKALWNALPQNQFAVSFPAGRSAAQIRKKEKNNEDERRETLEVHNIGYHYTNEPQLFEDVSFSVQPGEVVGLYGKSGSGKSTAAQIISGYKKPVRGRVTIGGASIAQSGRCPVQLVWQHPEKAINPKWRLKRMLKETEGFDQQLMEVLGIKEEWLARWPSELSGGELQRFCLARALANDGIRYLVADEMTTMLDAVTQAEIWHAVLEWAKSRQIGILAISHDRHLLEKIADRIIDFAELRKEERFV